MDLEQEARRATRMLKNKVVRRVLRHRKGTIVVQFLDGTTLFVDQTSEGLDMSITYTYDMKRKRAHS